MRLWTLHPRYLDVKGLCALWREALLAQAVLRGDTRGYRTHPQLTRFHESGDPRGCIAAYLRAVHREARRRGLRFDGRRIGRVTRACRINETTGQILYEWRHLRRKLVRRAPATLQRLPRGKIPESNPVFAVVAGPVRAWERRPGGAGGKRK